MEDWERFTDMEATEDDLIEALYRLPDREAAYDFCTLLRRLVRQEIEAAEARRLQQPKE